MHVYPKLKNLGSFIEHVTVQSGAEIHSESISPIPLLFPCERPCLYSIFKLFYSAHGHTLVGEKTHTSYIFQFNIYKQFCVNINYDFVIICTCLYINSSLQMVTQVIKIMCEINALFL